jgi:hypothetical protein
MQRTNALLLVSLTLFASACGSTVSGQDGGDDVSGLDASGDGAVVDTGVGVLPERGGTVTISAINAMIAGMAFQNTSVTAGFSSSVGGMVNARCSTRTVGGCQLISCAGGAADGGVGADAGAADSVPAGTLTITGGGDPITITPGMGGAYTFNEMRERFMAGANITVSASGDPMGVPMFSGMVTMPSAVNVTAPMLNPLMPLMVSRSAPLMVTWTGGTTGTVRALVIAGTAGGGAAGQGETLTCEFAAMSGMGTISSEALSALPAGQALLAISAANLREVTAGQYRITLIATNANSLPGGRVTLM